MAIEVGTETASGAVIPPPTRLEFKRLSILRGLVSDRTAVAGLIIIIFFLLVATVGPWLAPHDPNAADVVRKFAPPSGEFPLGTDHLGRDILSRLLYGARLSLGTVAIAAAAISMLGMTLGMLAGYFGGLIDGLISRTIDALLAFPPFLLALAITGTFGPSLRNVTLAIVLVWWASYARVVRASVLAEGAKPYVEAARAIGASPLRVLRRQVLPNIVGPVIILTTLDMGAILLGISALSFLGLGVEPPTAEWGAMLSEAQSYISRAPSNMFFPGAAIFLVVLACNLLGDGLRDALDPRTSGR